jgi:hypothetical protein
VSCDTGTDLSHRCVEKDFTIHQGAAWRSKPISFKNPDETYVDLTGCTFRGQARRDRGASTAVAFSFTFTLDTTTDPDKHSVTVTLAASVTDALTPIGKTPRDKDSIFYYDWEIVDSSSTPYRIFMGRIFIDRNMTR